MKTDIRWKQRFQNFDRAFILLRSALEENSVRPLSQLELEGVIQRFEYCYELAWKTISDYLKENGLIINPVTPRNIFKEAFASGIIDDGQVWIDMMLQRNLLSHTYDFNEFNNAVSALNEKFLYALSKLHEWFFEKLDEV
jgi:nucleotidyltransferase substrate binding protein (TIGR01987 family)